MEFGKVFTSLEVFYFGGIFIAGSEEKTGKKPLWQISKKCFFRPVLNSQSHYIFRSLATESVSNNFEPGCRKTFADF